jgi:hypothetical protein
MGIPELVSGLKNIQPMPIAAGAGMMSSRNEDITMNFNFAPGSVRNDGDIYALADVLEKRIARTLRQR